MFVESNEKTVSAVIKYIQNFDVETDFYSEIVVLFELYLVSPATNGVSEQSVCSVRRVKKWLRCTVPQERLNDCMLLSMHQEKPDEINLKYVANVFCESNEDRRRTFIIF